MMLARALGATRVGTFNAEKRQTRTVAPSKAACVRCSTARAAAALRADYTQPTWAQRMRASVDVRTAAANVVGNTKQAEEEEEEEEGMDESRALAIRLAIEADNVKAEDIVVLHVEEICSWASYFVIITARSRPQLDAVVARMRDAANEDFDRDFQKNPESSSHAWAVMDLGDVVCHVFTRQEREYYDLESFYAEAPVVELPFLQSPAMDDWANSELLYDDEDRTFQE